MTIYMKDETGFFALSSVQETTAYVAGKGDCAGLSVSFFNAAKDKEFLSGYTLADVKQDKGLTVIDVADRVERVEIGRIAVRDAAFARVASTSRWPKSPIEASIRERQGAPGHDLPEPF